MRRMQCIRTLYTTEQDPGNRAQHVASLAARPHRGNNLARAVSKPNVRHRWIATSLLIVALAGCSQNPGLHPACNCHDTPDPFIIVETEVEVVVLWPDAPEAALLATLDAVHKSHGGSGRTVVNFIAIDKLPPQRRMLASERVSLAFAEGVIDPVFGVRRITIKAMN